MFEVLKSNNRFSLKKFLRKTNLVFPEKVLEILDIISRKYSNYNKLTYLNKLLDTNYINIKKNALNNDTKNLQAERKRIQLSIHSALEKLASIKIKQDESFDENIELSLSGQIQSLEEIILNNIIDLQNLLVDSLINCEAEYQAIPYVTKLKDFEKILLVENEKLSQQIYNVITYRILNTFENTASNLIEKIKYSIANEVLSSDKYIKIYKDMNFKRLVGLTYKENTSIAAISVDNSFMQLVEISNLNKQAKNLKNNASFIHIDSLGYLIHNLSSKKDIDNLENIYTKLKSEFKEFSSVTIENIYITNLKYDYDSIFE